MELWRKKFAMLAAEFLGTGFLTLVVLAVQRSTIGVPYFVAIAAGFAVAALMYVFSNVSGAHLNPLVTIGLWSARKVKTIPAALYLIVQVLGGWAAYGVYTYFVNSSLPLLNGHITSHLYVAEGVGAFVFAFVWAAAAARRLSHAVAGVGFAVGIIIAAAASVGIINPALALGERAWVFWGSTGWIVYVLAPVIGGIVGFNLYDLIFGDARSWSLAKVGVGTRKPAASTTAAKSTASKSTAAKSKTTARKTTAKKRK